MTSLNIYLYFFLVIKFVCIFIKYLSVFFLVTKWICIFIKYRSEDFSRKSFLFYKIVDFEISKKELRVRLKFVLYVIPWICDACIINLNYEYEFFFTLYKNRSNFFNKILLFTLYKTNLIFYKSIFIFFSLPKQIKFFLQIKFHFLALPKQIWFLFIKPHFLILQNISNFSLRIGHIHKTNLFNFVK